MRFKSEYRTCQRCSGNGTLNQYAHIMHGQCFSCGGSGRFYEGEIVVDNDNQAAYGPVQEFDKSIESLNPFEVMLGL